MTSPPPQTSLLREDLGSLRPNLLKFPRHGERWTHSIYEKSHGVMLLADDSDIYHGCVIVQVFSSSMTCFFFTSCACAYLGVLF